jgi:hypothetical protein
MIPQRKLSVLYKLANRLAEKRVHLQNGKSVMRERANHASFVLEERGGIKIRPLSYGENSFRKRAFVSIHAEQHALSRLKMEETRSRGCGKKYSILVVKVSNSRTHFGPSSCCNRCQLHLSLAPIYISRVYYSTPEGIVMQRPTELESYMCGYDRDHQHSHTHGDENDEDNEDGEKRYTKNVGVT